MRDGEDSVARGQFEVEAREQFGDVSVGARYGSDGQFGLRFAASHGEDDVHAFDGAYFGDEFAGACSESFAVHPLFEHSPHRECQKAHKDVRFDSFDFVVVNGAQLEVAFGGAECGFGLREATVSNFPEKLE